MAPAEASGECRVVESAGGLVRSGGGRLTPYRVMGRDVVDRVAARLHALDGRPRAPRPPTDRVALPGGETADLEGLVKAATERGVRESIARHLVGAYGSEPAAVLNLADRDRVLGQPIFAGPPELCAEGAPTLVPEMALRVPR